jgi:hypothetical protein
LNGTTCDDHSDKPHCDYRDGDFQCGHHLTHPHCPNAQCELVHHDPDLKKLKIAESPPIPTIADIVLVTGRDVQNT